MDDERIINLFWQRSQEAIARIQQKYGAMCRSLAGKLLRSAEDVEECLSDVYMALWNAIPPERPTYLAAYISKITRNLAMQRLSYLNTGKRGAEAVLSFEELGECVSGSVDPVAVLEAKELEGAIAVFLRQQDKESRLIFLRRYYFFNSVKEIAEMYRISESKVKIKLFRTRNKLKEYLIKEGFLYER